jgi:DNA segregation ATPase FtsK/SpoIIIE-like protein
MGKEECIEYNIDVTGENQNKERVKNEVSNNDYMRKIFVGVVNIPDVPKDIRTGGTSGYFDKNQFDVDKVKAHCQMLAELHPEDQDYKNPMFLQALDHVLENGKYSAFMLQRKLNIGFNMAMRYIDKIRNIMSEC